ncbi:uncharacterized protein LOC123562889 [Mercenaria mercenaria]|uniref:uncharacterized protein LOC123562889 n=1 Tax=Mercenaria mercenaria TaxID=6596 RepID=UPI00234F4012|nr:uncharacterized protein LOC123562889 [Mercenaria mercenaria]
MDLCFAVLLLVLELTFPFWSSATAMSSKWKRRKEECKMRMDTITGQQQMNTLNGCIISCENTKNCQAVSWQLSGTTCFLSDKNVVDDMRAQYTKWELATSWLTYSKVNFPVARVMNPDSEKDMMTFDEAVQACLDQGAVIATPAQLEEARQLGMNSCACGWLSNGLNGGVTPLSNSCNQIAYTEEVAYCNNTKAVAWCKLN